MSIIRIGAVPFNPHHDGGVADFSPKVGAPRGKPDNRRTKTTTSKIRLTESKPAGRDVPLQQWWVIPPDFDLTHATCDKSARSEVARLRGRVNAFGLAIKKMKPNGACQFLAISDQLDGAIGPDALRQQVCNFISNHREVFVQSLAEPMTMDKYLQAMREPDEWGDHITLVAAASMLGRDIKMLSSVEGMLWAIVSPHMGLPKVEPTSTAPLWLAFEFERHYDSLYLAAAPQLDDEHVGTANYSRRVTVDGSSFTVRAYLDGGNFNKLMKHVKGMESVRPSLTLVSPEEFRVNVGVPWHDMPYREMRVIDHETKEEMPAPIFFEDIHCADGAAEALLDRVALVAFVKNEKNELVPSGIATLAFDDLLISSGRLKYLYLNHIASKVKGSGGALMDVAEMLARSWGYRFLSLEANDSRRIEKQDVPSLRMFYAKHGFLDIDENTEFDGEGDMYKDLGKHSRSGEEEPSYNCIDE